MKRIIIQLLLVFILTNIKGQTNLVVNGGYETMTNCPTGYTLIHYAAGWSAVCGSPDFYHACSTSSESSVPSNWFGSQFPATGNGYSGFHVFDSLLGIRENMEGKLSQSLIIGNKYYLSMKVSLAEWWHDGMPLYLACNNVGMKFSTISYSTATCSMINNFAHFKSDQIISDTTNWTLIQGSFVADSAYQYVTLGNFFVRAQMKRTSRENGFRSYYYVDDVIVSSDSTILDFTALNQTKTNEEIKVYPNPVNDQLNIENVSSGSDSWHLKILNLHGNILQVVTLQNSKKTLDLKHLDPGFYIIQFYKNNALQQTTRIVKH